MRTPTALRLKVTILLFMVLLICSLVGVFYYRPGAKALPASASVTNPRVVPPPDIMDQSFKMSKRIYGPDERLAIYNRQLESNSLKFDVLLKNVPASIVEWLTVGSKRRLLEKELNDKEISKREYRKLRNDLISAEATIVAQYPPTLDEFQVDDATEDKKGGTGLLSSSDSSDTNGATRPIQWWASLSGILVSALGLVSTVFFTWRSDRRSLVELRLKVTALQGQLEAGPTAIARAITA